MTRPSFRLAPLRGGLLACVALALAIAGPVECFGEASLAGNSPFLPEGGLGAAAAGAAPSDYVLAGSSVTDGHAVVCVVQSDTKRSRWIGVGETIDGIQVLSFDGDHDRAVILAHGARKEIGMRHATVVPARSSAVAPGAPLFVPQQVVAINPPAAGLPPAPAAPPAPEARAETEARMMVSDLLEIGMQQRKAYEEARNQPAGSVPAQPPK